MKTRERQGMGSRGKLGIAAAESKADFLLGADEPVGQSGLDAAANPKLGL